MGMFLVFFNGPVHPPCPSPALPWPSPDTGYAKGCKMCPFFATALAVARAHRGRTVAVPQSRVIELAQLEAAALRLTDPAKLKRLPVAARLRLVDGYAAHGVGSLFPGF